MMKDPLFVLLLFNHRINGDGPENRLKKIPQTKNPAADQTLKGCEKKEFCVGKVP
jgi:hypothetical protein